MIDILCCNPESSAQSCQRLHRILEAVMPLALVLVLLDILLVFHASRTGRIQPWAFIILLVPVIGAVAYIAIELIPELLGGPQAQNARRRVANKLDPEKLYRILSDQLENTDTIANRIALADECMVVGRFAEAENHYGHVLTLPLGREPAYALGKANAQLCLHRPHDAIATLDDLRVHWPDFESSDGHLLYARALAEAGRSEEALEEFQSVVTYFPGAEARARYGLLLEQLGRSAEAKAVFAELLIKMKRAPKYVREAQAEWLSIAEKRLAV